MEKKLKLDIFIWSLSVKELRKKHQGYTGFGHYKAWIGQYLYTLQSFYSNTNWVEMHEREINRDLGKFNRSDKIEFAGFLTPTCINKDYRIDSIGRRSCENNIIVTDKLTSGYRSGQDIQKPVSSGGITGKCSHGGELDTSRTRTATCGINKDTISPRFSPHWFLHYSAASLAISATEDFFLQKDSTSQLNTESLIFQNILGLKVKTGSSLAFVIDKSTSMREEIKEVTKWTVDKVSSVIGTPMEPANYVLVTFSDPIQYTSAFVTKDGNEMVNKLQSIIVKGGGTDCPELTFSGLRKAVELSMEGSTVICFTDDKSKDDHLKEEVTTSANSKNITLTFVTFKSACSLRKRSIQNYDTPKTTKRGVSSPVFEEVARATGGRVYSVSLKTVGNVLDEEFMANFPSSEVSVDFFQLNSSKAVFFYVDKNLLSFRVAITGKKDADEVYITSPSDERFPFIDGNTKGTSRIMLSENQHILIIPKPLAGRWELVSNHGNGDLVVNITGQSAFDFSFSLMEQTKDGNMYESVGNPVVGQNYTIIVTVFGQNVTDKGATLKLINFKGHKIREFSLDKKADFTNMSNQYFTSLTMVRKKFVFQFITQDDSGNTLKRINWMSITPVNVKLHLIPIYDMVTYGVEKNISFRISNPSNVVLNLESNIQISSGNIVSSATRHHAVNPGSEIEDYFTIRADILSSDIIIYYIQVNPSESREILQSLSGRLQVTIIQHPICHVVFKEGSCQNVTRSNCNKRKWFAITETMFSGTRISSVTLAKTGPHTNMTIGDIKAFNGQLQINISGTCCESYNRLEILDTDGYLAKCHLLFSSEVQLHIENNVKEQESNIVAIVCISLGVLLVFILITIALVKFIEYRRKTFLVN
ncbi:hypothetical protein KUTeg_015774 [Tegillarca granosa]|uniref:VWFA domain-containing protein n=1 Tax=Tegillarca granosa TaxID=220873 RepID=A0ABQ9ETV1_TEGGR|nr:hypothetical protein KUTeg_015774 [Tegillarca granosa]